MATRQEGGEERPCLWCLGRAVVSRGMKSALQACTQSHGKRGRGSRAARRELWNRLPPELLGQILLLRDSSSREQMKLLGVAVSWWRRSRGRGAQAGAGTCCRGGKAPCWSDGRRQNFQCIWFCREKRFRKLEGKRRWKFFSLKPLSSRALPRMLFEASVLYWENDLKNGLLLQ